MKLLLYATVLALSLVASYAQGQVVFANKVGTIVDAPVFKLTTQRGPGPDYTAQLLLQGAGGSLTPLTPSSVFRRAGSGVASIADRYWVNQTVDVPGVAPGENATFVVRVWRTSVGSFENAGIDRGESAPFTIAVGGGVLPPANLTTLQGFAFTLPEPSVIALAILGASGLFFLRKP